MHIEIYKLHAAAADDVSRRRDSANRMYVAISTSIGITMGVVGGWSGNEAQIWVVLTGLSLLGWIVQTAWLEVIMSYRQLNRAKFTVIKELEKKLEFDFYTQEEKEYGGGDDPSKYRQLTITERDLPRATAYKITVPSIRYLGSHHSMPPGYASSSR